VSWPLILGPPSARADSSLLSVRDDESWLGASGAGTLFDTKGNPKPAAYEVAARLQRYASGATELCSTAAGTSSCTVPKKA
jgi:hypothetical protein